VRGLPVGREVLAAVVLSSIVVLLYGLDPATSKFFPRCPFRSLTGLYCPGCGSLRAMHRLLHGNLGGALTMNSLMVLSLPGMAALSVRPSWRYRTWLPWVALAVLLAYGVARNVHAWPFELLAPH
jgi:hypothetical protein